MKSQQEGCRMLEYDDVEDDMETQLWEDMQDALIVVLEEERINDPYGCGFCNY